MNVLRASLALACLAAPFGCSPPTVTADNIAVAFASDPATATKMYSKAKTNVIGKVHSIDVKTGSDGQPSTRATLVTSARSPAVIVVDPPAAIAKEGATVDLLCTDATMSGSNVHLTGCTISP